ncbi:MAG: stage VI sporulation protein F [Bacilli bacterium]|nr:stage VI sporulation protein F [Bacilli bacterium]
MFGDNFFKRVENKTNVNKNTILSLAQRLQNGNMKDENSIRDVIKEISDITGKNISKEKEDKIVDSIIGDKIPKNIDKMF